MTIDSTIADNGTGAVTLAKSGAGVLTLGSANSHTGKTLVNGGTLVIADENRLGSNPASTVADQLTINGATLRTTANFSIDDANRGVTLGGGGGTFQTDPGTTLTVANAIAGTNAQSALTKTGGGILTLTAANTYAGATTITAGTLLANNTSGSATGGGNVVVNGGTFGGTGAITGGVTLNAGGILAPGESIGTLSTGSIEFTNLLNTQASASTFNPELNFAGSADLLSVTGTVTINNAILNLSFLNIASYTSPMTFLIVQNDNSDLVTGQFGFILNPANYAATLNYAFTGPDSIGRTGTGNDIAVTISAIVVPEPSGFALAAIATMAMVRCARRRSR